LDALEASRSPTPLETNLSQPWLTVNYNPPARLTYDLSGVRSRSHPPLKLNWRNCETTFVRRGEESLLLVQLNLNCSAITFDPLWKRLRSHPPSEFNCVTKGGVTFDLDISSVVTTRTISNMTASFVATLLSRASVPGFWYKDVLRSVRALFAGRLCRQRFLHQYGPQTDRATCTSRIFFVIDVSYGNCHNSNIAAFRGRITRCLHQNKGKRLLRWKTDHVVFVHDHDLKVKAYVSAYIRRKKQILVTGHRKFRRLKFFSATWI
jgi:hypothetical protein